MKLMIASDLHGSALYTRQLFTAYDKEQPDRLLLLGDLLYHGPRNDLPADYAPKEVISILNGHSAHLLCVRGNCDTDVDQMVLEFPILADSAMLYVDGAMVYAHHGHLPLPGLGGVLLVASGHTHVPAFRREGEVVYCNPGSVSIPKEESPHSYMLLENGLLVWKTLEGTVYQQHSL